MTEPPQAAQPVNDRKLDRLVRALTAQLQRNELDSFEAQIREAASASLITAVRHQKILTRGDASTRARAAQILTDLAEQVLHADAAAEFARYAELTGILCETREHLKQVLHSKKAKMPKLSMRQLFDVAQRTFIRVMHAEPASSLDLDPEAGVAENERRIHERYGIANDILFALTRALNETAVGLPERDLHRPDAIPKSLKIFFDIFLVSGQLCSLEYMLDAISFEDLTVSAIDPSSKMVHFALADWRRSLIRQLSIRRRIINVTGGRPRKRFVSEEIRPRLGAFLDAALDQYNALAGSVNISGEEIDRFKRDCDVLLGELNAEDDLLYLSASQDAHPALLYHVSLALRVHALVGELIGSKLSGARKRSFDQSISRSAVLNFLEDPGQRKYADRVLDELTIELPARGHFDVIRRPFVRQSPGIIRPIISAAYGSWTMPIREILNQGGEVGRLYGQVWEDFLARSFEGTGWSIIGRNIDLVDNGRTVTEIDMLLFREDLLVAAEIKALTGSGHSPYDHWKNRMIIEKGCRQARLASQYLSAHRQVIASIANRKIASAVRHIQPLVLTSEHMFDGWEYLGVPVAGETVRRAITVGTKVDYYDAATKETLWTEHHLKVEDISTETILTALRNPIELKLAPEQGAVRLLAQSLEGWTYLIPDLAVGHDDESNPRHGAIERIGS